MPTSKQGHVFAAKCFYDIKQPAKEATSAHIVFVNHLHDAAKTVRSQDAKLRSPNALTQREDVKQMPASIDLHGFKNEVVISFFVNNLFVLVKSPLDDGSSILHVFSGEADSTAGISGLCVAEAFFSSIHFIPEMKVHASTLYGRAVQKLKTDLGTKTETLRSLPHATIWSALFLGVYEMISSDSMSNWLQHCHGVAALTEMTGPYGFQIDTAKAILQINRSFISIGAMANRKRTFLEQDEWKHIPWALQPMSKTIGDYLQDILCDIPGMMEDVDNLFDANSCPVSIKSISQKLQAYFEKLNFLRISWNWVNPHGFWRKNRVRESSELYHETLEQALPALAINELIAASMPSRSLNQVYQITKVFSFIVIMQLKTLTFLFAAQTTVASQVKWAGQVWHDHLFERKMTNMSSVNLFGLANDVNILGSAYNTFLDLSCKPSYHSYPYINTVDDYKSWHDKGFNLFRIAMAWQHVQTSLGGSLNETNMEAVDKLVKAITDDGGQAILDIHNYARWYCAVIDQSEASFLNPNITVTNDHFADLWTRLTERFKSNPKVIFQLMNEPHDLDITKRGATNQAAILAIRNVTQNQKILVSGTQFARLVDWEAFSQPGIGPGLIQDPANNTLYDFHQYFDDIAGAYGLCEPWSGFVKGFEAVTRILRHKGLQGMVTEFGGGPFPQCADTIQSILAFLDRNSDVWYGWTAWGSFNEGSDLYLSLDKNSTYNLITRTLEKFVPK
ncbi:endoglucanase EG-II [Fusarium denticulatum]|uniref:cellulase n=1 Tax=Fusarium denticulatum TaxID=48507 RepID=A0A8H5XC14_9HYPO|nr:endoglucanase EG-II [Fusarium denticulatum]